MLEVPKALCEGHATGCIGRLGQVADLSEEGVHYHDWSYFIANGKRCEVDKAMEKRSGGILLNMLHRNPHSPPGDATRHFPYSGF
jgi:hypothetical protein